MLEDLGTAYKSQNTTVIKKTKNRDFYSLMIFKTQLANKCNNQSLDRNSYILHFYLIVASRSTSNVLQSLFGHLVYCY